MKKLLLCCGLFLSVGYWALGQTASPRGLGGASWVWDQPEANKHAQGNEPRYLRRTFTLPSRPVQARLWISADNHYVAYVNGHKVGADGEWSTVEEYDVTRHLVVGKNLLAFQARNQGGPAGIIARLQIKTAEKEIVVVTDQQTKITQGAAKDWQQLDCDDSSWFAAIVLGEVGIGPWNLGGQAVAAGTGKGYDIGAVDGKIRERLTPQEQQKHFNFPEGFALELVAADPLVINPITMTLDEKGRIYVSESHTYRYGPPGSPIKPFANPVIRLDPISDPSLNKGGNGGVGFKRTLVADGFDDPVMGMAIRDNKLWLTANNYLYLYDLTEEGKAINKKTILVDKNKAWNPFGMFVLEFGPDGLLYMSVGDHVIDIRGPDGQIGGRRNTGIIMRCRPDGTKMERLVQGLRVPYSYDFDPFGQLWLLSNGEGNPNRFVRVLENVDYHCYTRSGVDNNWLAGNHVLAPPCFELVRGAHTQLMRYYGAAFPQKYQGNLFLDNWGAHGFAGPNRAIFRFATDERNHITTKDGLLSCTDPHFRPSHIVLDPDGNLLVADWYGRDDESDMTGRIWRLKYVGPDRPQVTHKLEAPEWSQDDYAITALGSPHHLIREKATAELLKRGPKMVGRLADCAAACPRPLGAAQALWTLVRLDTPESRAAIAAGAGHADWKVRRLAINLLQRYPPSSPLGKGGKSEVALAAEVARKLGQDKEPAVRVAAAQALPNSPDIRAALVDALNNGAADDDHLRYEAARHLAKHSDAETLSQVLAAGKENVRLAGLIAIDIACYEDFASKKTALAVLGRVLENPGALDHGLLLTLAQLNGDASIAPALQKLVARQDLPLAVTAKAILLLKTKAGGLSKNLGASAGKRLIEAVEKGALRIASPADQLTLFEFLESEGPTPFALQQIGSQLRSNHVQLRQAAHLLARRFGVKSAPLAETLWPSVLAPKTKLEDAVEQLSTIARIEGQPRKETWGKLLNHENPLLRAEAVRWWRGFKDRPELVELLIQEAPELVKNQADIRDDLGIVFRSLEKMPEPIKTLNLPEPIKDKEALAKHTLAAWAALAPAEKQKRAVLGQQVFERSACTKCHTTATQTTMLAPSLQGIAAQKIDYLIESVLYPSKIIKTGFESETVTTASGQVLTGLVKDDGTHLRILNLDRDQRIVKGQVESRSVARVSVMPEGQEAQLSRREFLDLIAYLMTLK